MPWIASKYGALSMATVAFGVVVVSYAVGSPLSMRIALAAEMLAIVIGFMEA